MCSDLTQPKLVALALHSKRKNAVNISGFLIVIKRFRLRSEDDLIFPSTSFGLLLLISGVLNSLLPVGSMVSAIQMEPMKYLYSFKGNVIHENISSYVINVSVPEENGSLIKSLIGFACYKSKSAHTMLVRQLITNQSGKSEVHSTSLSSKPNFPLEICCPV